MSPRAAPEPGPHRSRFDSLRNRARPLSLVIVTPSIAPAPPPVRQAATAAPRFGTARAPAMRCSAAAIRGGRPARRLWQSAARRARMDRRRQALCRGSRLFAGERPLRRRRRARSTGFRSRASPATATRACCANRCTSPAAAASSAMSRATLRSSSPGARPGCRPASPGRPFARPRPFRPEARSASARDRPRSRSSISTPRFIGPGCITTASGAARARRSAVSP